MYLFMTLFMVIRQVYFVMILSVLQQNINAFINFKKAKKNYNWCTAKNNKWPVSAQSHFKLEAGAVDVV